MMVKHLIASGVILCVAMVGGSGCGNKKMRDRVAALETGRLTEIQHRYAVDSTAWRLIKEELLRRGAAGRPLSQRAAGERQDTGAQQMRTGGPGSARVKPYKTTQERSGKEETGAPSPIRSAIARVAKSVPGGARTIDRIQGEWVIEEWTGYKPLAVYPGCLAVSTGNDYSGSRVTVSGSRTTWKLRITQRHMDSLLLGLFTGNADIKQLYKDQDGNDRPVPVDQAVVTEMHDGNPGRMVFRSVYGASEEYAAIWGLQGDHLTLVKAKSPGVKCAESLDIPTSDFENTRIVLRRVAGKG
jgi:hypothetical protein